MACPRALQLIRDLGLAPHPEGGHFGETFRSPGRVTPADGRGERPALTTIYFLLAAGEVSRWHRVVSDEVWHHCEGAPLELLELDPEFTRLDRRRLGPLSEDVSPVRVVAAHQWQAARSLGDYTLAACVVGPGFDFADFTILRDLPDLAARCTAQQPEGRGFL